MGLYGRLTEEQIIVADLLADGALVDFEALVAELGPAPADGPRLPSFEEWKKFVHWRDGRVRGGEVRPSLAARRPREKGLNLDADFAVLPIRVVFPPAALAFWRWFMVLPPASGVRGRV